MTADEFLRVIYGVAIVIVLYLLVREIYSVYYVGGSVVYGSPVTQKLFPGVKMHPTWGYNKLGLMSDSGQGKYWPETVQRHVSKSGSGGISPSGGERNAKLPMETDVGWWNGAISRPIHSIQNIYDTKDIPETKVWNIGHWSDF